MTFQQYEDSTNLGEPIELFLFEYGAGNFYAYTSATKTVTLDGVVYTPVPIERDAIKTSGKVEDDSIKITVSRDSEIGELYRIFPPTQTVSLTIRQGHIPVSGSLVFTAADFLICWIGTIKQTSNAGASVELTGELISSAANTPGLRRNYQWSCPLVLYGPRCLADKPAATTATTVSAISTNRLTPAPGWVPALRVEDDFIGGFVEWAGVNGTDYRTVLDVVAGQLVLSGVPTGLANGDPFNVVLGCPHTLQGCFLIHNNAPNYGGQPLIPRNNPTGKNNHY